MFQIVSRSRVTFVELYTIIFKYLSEKRAYKMSYWLSDTFLFDNKAEETLQQEVLSSCVTSPLSMNTV